MTYYNINAKQIGTRPIELSGNK